MSPVRIPVEIGRGANKREMREGLWEVSADYLITHNDAISTLPSVISQNVVAAHAFPSWNIHKKVFRVNPDRQA
jgi:hypothetical protein